MTTRTSPMPSSSSSSSTAAERIWARMLLRRALQAVALALIVGTLCFAMARTLPGDMATRIAAGRYGYDLVSNAAAAAVRGELGLDRPVWQALLAWWGDIVRLDLGTSYVSGDPVWREIAHPLAATVELSLAALLIGMALGLPAGIWTGLHPGGRTDRAVAALSVLLRAMPPFLLAVLLMLAMAVHLGMLPVAGDDHAASLLLPALTLGLGLAAGLARVSGAAMRQAAASPSLAFARSKGAHRRAGAVAPRAAAGRAAGRGLPRRAGRVPGRGAVVVETLFAWPGIGHALVHAVFGRDVPMIQGAALCMGLLFVFFNLLVDAACVAIDPRRSTEVRA
ncbi:ABC transporter permease subunit [Acidovorax citrulli]|nr:ABC transporter permease subunit [Paracidovorax citrulli]